MHSYWEEKFVTLLKKSIKTKEEIEEMQHARLQLEKELNTESGELVENLKKKGINLNHIWDLVNTRESYPEAIDLLTEHLSRDYHYRNKEGIIRALGVKESGLKTIRALIQEYPKIIQKDIKFAILNAICTILGHHKPKVLILETNDNEILIKEMINYVNGKKIDPIKFSKHFEEKLKHPQSLC
ncbi:hypothetical protein [Elizabethkingia ursingii]|uniref:hypothetical protein n=1 Tax=Elizabethkingia ursingii TaxID=1756150 RepID=UPI002012A371|nr:hypothetical protein [Elizabethkingia ursingii]MCL1665583.1 hypothetical protein [Elizabethkingia ursingii]MCL1671573.1 hypothetical protein [Elizabethkingia ursingii]